MSHFLRAISDDTARRLSLCARIAAYLAIISLVLGAALNRSKRYRESYQPSLTGGAEAKTRYYGQHSAEYDLVFLGDSRTYCGIHPELIDRELGSKSVNLAVFAHWFPTQFPQIQDVIEFAPAQTVVVWTIGAQNFHSGGSDLWATNSPYRLKPCDVPRYLIWGFKPGSLLLNFYKRSAFYDLVETLRASGATFRQLIRETVYETKRPLKAQADSLRGLAATRANQVSEQRYATKNSEPRTALEIIANLRTDPNVADAYIQYDEGRPTSIVGLGKTGAYSRLELDSAFFRTKQRENAGAPMISRGGQMQIETPYWNLFLATLDFMSRKHVRLIVNEIEEAPYIYGNREARRAVVEAMRRKVEVEVRKRGFEYVRVDFEKLSDEDYFDYNHLNSRGIERYTPLLCEQLRRSLGTLKENRAACAF